MVFFQVTPKHDAELTIRIIHKIIRVTSCFLFFISSQSTSTAVPPGQRCAGCRKASMAEKYPWLNALKKKTDGHDFMLQAVFYTVENNVHIIKIKLIAHTS